MSTTTTTKFYVQVQAKEGFPWAALKNHHDTHKEAQARVEAVIANNNFPDAHAFRITRETITTNFVAYQPITNPAQPASRQEQHGR